MSSDSTRIVHEWLAAVNAGDVDGVLALTSPDVTIVGPRGVARGHDVLRAWMGHAGATFQTRETFGADEVVVIAQRGVWRDPRTGEIVGEADVATRFRVKDGRVAEMERYDELHAALQAAGLTESDRQSAGS